MEKIVLAGGSGHVGQILAESFLALDNEVYILTRGQRSSQRENLHYVQWSGEQLGPWQETLEGADVLINLSGESINKRLTEKNKRALEDSRIKPTRALGEAVANSSNPPKLWINFSGASLFDGQQGLHTEESSAVGDSFLAELVQKWEHAFWAADTPRTARTVLRLSPVLQRSGGMFAELFPLVRLGLGGKVGDGKQYVSWIHEQDLLRVVHWIANYDARADLYHACAPQPVPNADFMKALRKVAGVPFGLPLPTPLAKVGAFIKRVDEGLLLETVSVISGRLEQEGFDFKYPDVHSAFAQLVEEG